MNTQFEAFKQILITALTDESFVRGNVLMQNDTFKAELLARVNSLQPGQNNIKLVADDVAIYTRNIAIDVSESKITFPADKYVKVVSTFDNMVLLPSYLWSRAPNGAPTPADGVRYVLTDVTSGVLYLSGSLAIEIVGTLPNNGTLAGGGYLDPVAAITFTVAGTEYIAVAMQTHHIVRIYDYSTGVFVSQFGVTNVSGADATHLDQPVALAFDPITNYLYILSQLGIPAGAIADGGFVSRVDLTVPVAPVFVDFFLMHTFSGSLLNGEIHRATSLFLEGNKLWFTNGTPVEVAAINTTSKLCVQYFGATTFANPSSIGGVSIRTDTFGDRYLYVTDVANEVLVLNLQSNTLKATYGFRQAERDYTINFQNLPLITQLMTVVPDVISIGGSPTNVFLVCDTLNKRLVLVDEFDELGRSAQCLFKAVQLAVPVKIEGYALTSNIPASNIRVEYRASAIDSWHRLNQEDTTPASSYFQFRLNITLPFGYVSNNWFVQQLALLGEQI